MRTRRRKRRHPGKTETPRRKRRHPKPGATPGSECGSSARPDSGHVRPSGRGRPAPEGLRTTSEAGSEQTRTRGGRTASRRPTERPLPVGQARRRATAGKTPVSTGCAAQRRSAQSPGSKLTTRRFRIPPGLPDTGAFPRRPARSGRPPFPAGRRRLPPFRRARRPAPVLRRLYRRSTVLRKRGKVAPPPR